MNSATDTQYALVLKKDCATCRLIEPVARELADQLNGALRIYVQDDPSFPTSIDSKIDDTELEFSYHNKIEVVPTLIRFQNDQESERVFGWDKKQWQEFLLMDSLGDELPEFRPGCGSKSQDPGMEEMLAVKFGGASRAARELEIADHEDLMEACYDRGWTDGLPVVPPTPLRVARMLAGTDRQADEIIGNIP
ncbi:MAG: thioredoxin family protein, partial [Gammaproteobacteria bacterium]|nr:thioredoxin family protein [Gammaproteobacteria bacterium]